MRPSRLPAVVLAFVCLALPGLSCGPGRPVVHPVRGQVSFKNKPTQGAMVVFHPAGNDDPKAPRPYGKVQQDGSFTLTTFTQGDGAPEGEYDVAIVWTTGKANAETGEMKNQLPERYSNPRESQLRAKVEKGENNLPPFQLTP